MPSSVNEMHKKILDIRGLLYFCGPEWDGRTDRQCLLKSCVSATKKRERGLKVKEKAGRKGNVKTVDDPPRKGKLTASKSRCGKVHWVLNS